MHVQDPVRVDVERDFDLGDAAGCWWDADEFEAAERLVVHRHLALALEHVDRDRRLVVCGGREHLALVGWDRRVALDQPRGYAAQGLDAQRQRCHVEE